MIFGDSPGGPTPSPGTDGPGGGHPTPAEARLTSPMPWRTRKARSHRHLTCRVCGHKAVTDATGRELAMLKAWHERTHGRKRPFPEVPISQWTASQGTR